MKIEIGMYMRFNGFISKIEHINISQKGNVYIHFKEPNGILAHCNSELINKASYNITDLIEEGDYVNGHLVTKISKDRFIWLEGYNKDRTWTYVDFINEWGDNIKSIVTKEQFESLMYEVE